MEARKDAVETLISILEEQEKIYEELLELARQKQKILIKGDIAALAGDYRSGRRAGLTGRQIRRKTRALFYCFSARLWRGTGVDAG
ncbi:MAG: flagellar export chaperone FlgN [Peptococcia bacterium]